MARKTEEQKAKDKATKDALKLAANAGGTENTTTSKSALSVFEKMLEGVPKSGTVTVGCKLPNGPVLRIFEMIKQREPVLGGGTRMLQIAQAVGPEVRLQGSNVPFGRRPNYDIIGDFALTKNVDAAFFRTWLIQNRDSDLVKNKLIFCYKSLEDARAHAADNAHLKSGLEPLIRSEEGGDPRVPKAGNKNLADIQTADV